MEVFTMRSFANCFLKDLRCDEEESIISENVGDIFIKNLFLRVFLCDLNMVPKGNIISA